MKRKRNPLDSHSCDYLPLPIQNFLLSQTCAFIQPSVARESACVTFERVLVQNNLNTRSPAFCEAFLSVNRWRVIKAAFPHVMHCAAIMLQEKITSAGNMNTTAGKRFDPAETRLLYTLHWIIMDAAAECEDADREKEKSKLLGGEKAKEASATSLDTAYIHDIMSVQLFVYLFAPLIEHLCEEDFQNSLKLEKGVCLWQPLRNFHQPNILCFSCPVKPRASTLRAVQQMTATLGNQIYVGRGTSMEKLPGSSGPPVSKSGAASGRGLSDDRRRYPIIGGQRPDSYAESESTTGRHPTLGDRFPLPVGPLDRTPGPMVDIDEEEGSFRGHVRDPMKRFSVYSQSLTPQMIGCPSLTTISSGLSGITNSATSPMHPSSSKTPGGAIIPAPLAKLSDICPLSTMSGDTTVSLEVYCEKCNTIVTNKQGEGLTCLCTDSSSNGGSKRDSWAFSDPILKKLDIPVPPNLDYRQGVRVSSSSATRVSVSGQPMTSSNLLTANLPAIQRSSRAGLPGAKPESVTPFDDPFPFGGGPTTSMGAGSVSYNLQEDSSLLSEDVLQASHFDLAVLRCLFCSQWSKSGVFWAMRYLHKRLLEINRELATLSPEQKERSKSMPLLNLNFDIFQAYHQTNNQKTSSPVSSGSAVRFTAGGERSSPTSITGSLLEGSDGQDGNNFSDTLFPSQLYVARSTKRANFPDFKKKMHHMSKLTRIESMEKDDDSLKSLMAKSRTAHSPGSTSFENGFKEDEEELTHTSPRFLSSALRNHAASTTVPTSLHHLEDNHHHHNLSPLSRSFEANPKSKVHLNGPQSSIAVTGLSLGLSDSGTFLHEQDSSKFASRKPTTSNGWKKPFPSSTDDSSTFINGLSNLHRCFTDSLINYSLDDQVEEAAGSIHYIQENGHLKYTMILKAVYWVARNHAVPPICEFVMHCLVCLMDLNIFDRAPRKKRSSHPKHSDPVENQMKEKDSDEGEMMQENEETAGTPPTLVPAVYASDRGGRRRESLFVVDETQETHPTNENHGLSNTSPKRHNRSKSGGTSSVSNLRRGSGIMFQLGANDSSLKSSFVDLEEKSKNELKTLDEADLNEDKECNYTSASAITAPTSRIYGRRSTVALANAQLSAVSLSASQNTTSNVLPTGRGSVAGGNSVHTINVEHKAKRQEEKRQSQIIHFLGMDIIFRVLRSIGCPHGHGDNSRYTYPTAAQFSRNQGRFFSCSHPDIASMREQAHACLLRFYNLHRPNFCAYLAHMAAEMPLQDVMDTLHALTGFCKDPAVLHQITRPSVYIDGKNNYKNCFGQSVSGEGTRGAEGVCISALLKPLVRRFVSSKRELQSQENMSLYCDVRQMMLYFKEVHGSTFRRILLSSLLQALQKSKLRKKRRVRATVALSSTNPSTAKSSIGVTPPRNGKTVVLSNPSQSPHLRHTGDALKQVNVTSVLTSLALPINSTGVFSDPENNLHPGKNSTRSSLSDLDELPSLSTPNRSSRSKGIMPYLKRRRTTKIDTDEGDGDERSLESPSITGSGSDNKHTPGGLMSVLTSHRKSILAPLAMAGIDARSVHNGKLTLMKTPATSRLSFRLAGQTALLVSSMKRRQNELRRGDKRSKDESCSPTPSDLFTFRLRERRPIDIFTLRKDLAEFNFMLECCEPGSVPDAQMLAALLDLEAPVAARACILLECSYFVARCRQGEWPAWMRFNVPTYFRNSSLTAGTTGGTNSPPQAQQNSSAQQQQQQQQRLLTGCSSSRKMAHIQRMAGRLFHAWAEALGSRLGYLLGVEISQDTFGNVVDVTDDAKKRELNAKDQEEDFLDDSTVNENGEDCPYALKAVAVHLLLELTTYLREVHQYQPPVRSFYPNLPHDVNNVDTAAVQLHPNRNNPPTGRQAVVSGGGISTSTSARFQASPTATPSGEEGFVGSLSMSIQSSHECVASGGIQHEQPHPVGNRRISFAPPFLPEISSSIHSSIGSLNQQNEGSDGESKPRKVQLPLSSSSGVSQLTNQKSLLRRRRGSGSFKRGGIQQGLRPNPTGSLRQPRIGSIRLRKISTVAAQSDLLCEESFEDGSLSSLIAVSNPLHSAHIDVIQTGLPNLILPSPNPEITTAVLHEMATLSEGGPNNIGVGEQINSYGGGDGEYITVFEDGGNAGVSLPHSPLPIITQYQIADNCANHMPWLKVITQFANRTNFVCEHQGYCHPNCYERQQRQCRRLLNAIRHIYSPEMYAQRLNVNNADGNGRDREGSDSFLGRTAGRSVCGSLFFAPSWLGGGGPAGTASGTADVAESGLMGSTPGLDAGLQLFQLQRAISDTEEKKTSMFSKSRRKESSHPGSLGAGGLGLIQPRGRHRRSNATPILNIPGVGITKSRSSVMNRIRSLIPGRHSSRRSNSEFSLFHGRSGVGGDDGMSNTNAAAAASLLFAAASGDVDGDDDGCDSGTAGGMLGASRVASSQGGIRDMGFLGMRKPRKHPMIKYIDTQVYNLMHNCFSIVNKSALLLTEDHYADIMPVAWELLLETDQELAASAASVFLLSAVKTPDMVQDLIFRELAHEEVHQRMNAILRFRSLWLFRFQLWPRLEDQSQGLLKLPPPFIEYVLPSPTLGNPGADVPDPPWTPRRGQSAEEVQLKQNEATKTFVTASTTRRKQQQEMLEKAANAEEEKRKTARQEFHLSTCPVLERASLEPAVYKAHNNEVNGDEGTNSNASTGLVMSGQGPTNAAGPTQEEFQAAVRRLSVAPLNRAMHAQSRNLSWRHGSISWFKTAVSTSIPEEEVIVNAATTTPAMQVSHAVFPAPICAAVIPIVHLLDDVEVNQDGVAVCTMAEQVVWQCLVEDCSLFLRFILERLTREQNKEGLIFVLRKLVQRLSEVPNQAAHTIFNNLVGYIMFYVRTPTFSAPEYIASALSITWMVVPYVQNIYFKDLKQILRKEQVDPTLMVTANLPCAKQFNVFDDDVFVAQLVRLQDETKDYRFADILQEALEDSNIPEDEHPKYFLCDDRSNIIRNSSHYVRDFYFFKRNQTPKLRLKKMDPPEGNRLLQRNAFNLKFLECGKIMFSYSILKQTSPQQSNNHVFFLYEELSKLPSFPRKALESEFSLYEEGELNIPLQGMDMLHKWAWCKLVALLFEKMSSSFPWGTDMQLFLNVFNGAIVLHSEDTGLLRANLANYIRVCQHFKTVFSTNGYNYIMPTLLRVYDMSVYNPVTKRAIEFTCKQFYILHRTPFILQMFGSVANFIDLEHGDGATAVFYKIAPRTIYDILTAIASEPPDELNILSLLGPNKPLKALDFCYENETNNWSILESINLCVTVIAYAPESFRARQMMIVLRAILPFLLHDLPLIIKREQIGGDLKKHEIQAISQLSVAMKQLIMTTDWMIRQYDRQAFGGGRGGAGVGQGEYEKSSFRNMNHSPPCHDDRDESPFRGYEETGTSSGQAPRSVGGPVACERKGGNSAATRLLRKDTGVSSIEDDNRDRCPATSHITAYSPSRMDARETVLHLACDFFTACYNRLLEMNERNKTSELLDYKAHLRLSELAQTILKRIPRDYEMLRSKALLRYFTEIVPLSDWGQDSLRSCKALENLIYRLNRTLNKIFKDQGSRRFVDWSCAATLVESIYRTVEKNRVVAHLKDVRNLVDYLRKLVLMDPSSNTMNESVSSLQFSGRHEPISFSPSHGGNVSTYGGASSVPPRFSATFIKLLALMLQHLGPLYKLKDVCERTSSGDTKSCGILDGGTESVSNYLANIIIPLLFRCGAGRRNSPILSEENVVYCLDAILLALAPLGSSNVMNLTVGSPNVAGQQSQQMGVLRSGGMSGHSGNAQTIIIGGSSIGGAGGGGMAVNANMGSAAAQPNNYPLNGAVSAHSSGLLTSRSVPLGGSLTSLVGLSVLSVFTIGGNMAVRQTGSTLHPPTRPWSRSSTSNVSASSHIVGANQIHHLSMATTQMQIPVATTPLTTATQSQMYPVTNNPSTTFVSGVTKAMPQTAYHTDLTRSCSVSHSEKSMKFFNDHNYRLGFVGLKVILLLYPQHLYPQHRRICTVLTELALRKQGGIHFWKFWDYMLTHKLGILISLLPFLRHKLHQIPCDTQGEKALQQIVTQKLIGMHVTPARSESSLLRDLAQELKAAKDDLLSGLPSASFLYPLPAQHYGGTTCSPGAAAMHTNQNPPPQQIINPLDSASSVGIIPSLTNDSTGSAAGQGSRGSTPITCGIANYLSQVERMAANKGNFGDLPLSGETGGDISNATFAMPGTTSATQSSVTRQAITRNSSKRIGAREGTRILQKYQSQSRIEPLPIITVNDSSEFTTETPTHCSSPLTLDLDKLQIPTGNYSSLPSPTLVEMDISISECRLKRKVVITQGALSSRRRTSLQYALAEKEAGPYKKVSSLCKKPNGNCANSQDDDLADATSESVQTHLSGSHHGNVNFLFEKDIVLPARHCDEHLVRNGTSANSPIAEQLESGMSEDEVPNLQRIDTRRSRGGIPVGGKQMQHPFLRRVRTTTMASSGRGRGGVAGGTVVATSPRSGQVGEMVYTPPESGITTPVGGSLAMMLPGGELTYCSQKLIASTAQGENNTDAGAPHSSSLDGSSPTTSAVSAGETNAIPDDGGAASYNRRYIQRSYSEDRHFSGNSSAYPSNAVPAPVGESNITPTYVPLLPMTVSGMGSSGSVKGRSMKQRHRQAQQQQMYFHPHGSGGNNSLGYYGHQQQNSTFPTPASSNNLFTPGAQSHYQPHIPPPSLTSSSTQPTLQSLKQNKDAAEFKDVNLAESESIGSASHAITGATTSSSERVALLRTSHV